MSIGAEGIIWEVQLTKDSPRSNTKHNETYPICLKHNACHEAWTIHSRKSIIKLRDALNEALEKTQPEETNKALQLLVEAVNILKEGTNGSTYFNTHRLLEEIKELL